MLNKWARPFIIQSFLVSIFLTLLLNRVLLLKVIVETSRCCNHRIRNVPLRHLAEVVNALIKVEKCLISIILLLRILLFIPLLHLSNFLSPSVNFLDIGHISLWILLNLDHIHCIEHFGRVHDASIVFTLLQSLIQ